MNNDLFQQAKAAAAAKDYEQALNLYTSCLQDAENPLAPGETGLVYHQIGNCLTKLKNNAEAINAYTQATADTAYDACGTVNYNLGMSYAAMHDYDNAVKHFEIAVSDANYASPYKAYMGMGNVLMKQGKSAEAGVAFREAALDEANADPTKALLNLGVCTEPEGWGFEVPEGAKEITWFKVLGHIPAPCLILKNDEGIYDRLAIYNTKEVDQPMVVLEKDAYTANVPDMSPTRDGSLEHVVRNMRLLDLAEDGSKLRLWYSAAFSADDNRPWYPQWIFDECTKKFGPPVPTGQIANDFRIMNDCNLEMWRQAGKWQADCLNYMIKEHGVEVIFSHYHLVDMSGHTYMNVMKERYDSRYTEEEIYECAIGTYKACDEYIGEFLHLLDEGWTILLFSDHGLLSRKEDFDPLIGDNYGVNAGVMCELGYTVMKKDKYMQDTADIDWDKTRAIQMGGNSIFINLKGRDRHGIVDPADKYELEEQIISDLYSYRDPFTNHRVIAFAFHQKDAKLLGLGGPDTGADIVFCVDENYVYDHGESLSTAEGYQDTSTSPIFIAAGAGIKEGFEMKQYPREVDVAPTVATLLGVKFPAQCEGAPAYSIFTEDV